MSTDVKFGNHVGKYIRKLRKDQNIKLDELARKTDLDVVFLDLIERDIKTISLDTLLKIAKVLNIKLKDMEDFRLP